jgi:hypothetical protein
MSSQCGWRGGFLTQCIPQCMLAVGSRLLLFSVAAYVRFLTRAIARVRNDKSYFSFIDKYHIAIYSSHGAILR